MWYKFSKEFAYQSGHTAPNKTSGNPIHDLTEIYPDDFYGPKGLQYYGEVSLMTPQLIQFYIL
jgi:hypothetical protein